MGSESKSRKRRSSRSPSSSLQSSQETLDEEERRRKRRKGEDKERKSRRDDDEKKKKRKKKSREKSHKHSRSRDEGESEKRSKGKHKHSKKNFDSHDFKELSKDDYFSKNNEFSTWLKEEKHIYFSDLSSEAARDLFSSFVKDWNNQKLDPQYYEGISTAPRTAHNWKIRREKQ